LTAHIESASSDPTPNWSQVQVKGWGKALRTCLLKLPGGTPDREHGKTGVSEKMDGWIGRQRRLRCARIQRPSFLSPITLSPPLFCISHVEVDIEGVPARKQAAQDERVAVRDLASYGTWKERRRRMMRGGWVAFRLAPRPPRACPCSIPTSHATPAFRYLTFSSSRAGDRAATRRHRRRPGGCNGPAPPGLLTRRREGGPQRERRAGGRRAES